MKKSTSEELKPNVFIILKNKKMAETWFKWLEMAIITGAIAFAAEIKHNKVFDIIALVSIIFFLWSLFLNICSFLYLLLILTPWGKGLLSKAVNGMNFLGTKIDNGVDGSMDLIRGGPTPESVPPWRFYAGMLILNFIFVIFFIFFVFFLEYSINALSLDRWAKLFYDIFYEILIELGRVH